MKILLLYQVCSFGGVERVILNRAKTFRNYRQRIKLSVGYLQDFGALQSFQNYIHVHGLDEYLSAFLLQGNVVPDPDQYDLVFNIDTPQFFERELHARKLFVECHTSIVENRRYLKTLPPTVRGIVVPSHAFKSILVREFQNLPPIFILPNPVAEDFFNIPLSGADRIYPAAPLAYLARVDDELKNFSETARIFELFANESRVMFAVVGRGVENTELLQELETKGMIGKTFLRSQIDFDAVPAFVKMIKDHGGMLVSSSNAESFGLSAAEFISAGVPVLLSDIGSHRELVNHDENFLYSLGDIHAAQAKILDILQRWDESSKTMQFYGQKFNGDSFMAVWQEFLEFHHNQ